MQTNTLVVNDLLGNRAGGVSAGKAFKSFSLNRTSVNSQVGRDFKLGFF
jgi:hypothetical protein